MGKVDPRKGTVLLRRDKNVIHSVKESSLDIQSLAKEISRLVIEELKKESIYIPTFHTNDLDTENKISYSIDNNLIDVGLDKSVTLTKGEQSDKVNPTQIQSDDIDKSSSKLKSLKRK